MASTSIAQGGQGGLDTPAGLSADLLDKHERSGSLYKGAVIIFSILFVLGIIGFIIRLVDGVNDKIVWGYYAAVFAFILSTAQAAPLVAIAPRLTKAQWRRSTSRVAELWTIVGLFNLILFIPLLWVLPSLKDGRRTLWFFDLNDPGKVPQYSPHLWATLAIVGLVIMGLMLLWLSAMPDLAYVREHSTGWRQRWAARLSKNWIGTSQQWNMLNRRMGIVSAFYFMMLILVHFLISVDFMMALVPGWIDSLFPITHAANALQAGVATVVLTLWILRRFGGYEEYITLDQFWALGKLMFALSLLWIWFWFSSFNVLWYGKKPNEQAALQMIMIGPYLPAFFASFILNFIVPLFTMMWNPLRKSTWGPPLIAISVLFGILFDRIRLYVAAYSIPDEFSSAHALPLDRIPAAHMPDIADIFIILGAISGSILLYMLAAKLIPPVNIWEQKELLLYKVHKKFHRTEVMVLGKPD